MRAEGLGGFIGRTVLWLPPCLAAWYWTAPFHGQLAGSIAKAAIDVFRPGLVTALERDGSQLDFVTRLAAEAAAGQNAVLVPDVNPLIYTYGLAFLVALMLASRAKLWKIALAAVALLPFQAWGIAFDFLAQVGVRLGPQVATQAGIGGAEREVIALGFQLGSLIFPTLVPVAFWGLFDRPFVEGLLRRRAGGSPA